MLLEVLTRVAIVVGFMLAVAILTILGIGRLRAALTDWRGRVRAALPIAVALVPVLYVNRVARQELVDFSETYGIRLSGLFYEVEGEFVLLFQSIANEPMTWYFSFVYVYGYAFLLLFPVVAYFTLRDTRPLRRLLAAYALNYTLGVAFYVLVHAFGPRNVFSGEIETMLYTFRPEIQHLTREVNVNSNVFPSLHTSLSATVAIFAHRTRRELPLWTPVAIPVAVSVWISTMYLGIHWAIDVIGGLALAAACVWIADRSVGRWDVYGRLDPVVSRLEPVRDRLLPVVEPVRLAARGLGSLLAPPVARCGRRLEPAWATAGGLGRRLGRALRRFARRLDPVQTAIRRLGRRLSLLCERLERFSVRAGAALRRLVRRS